MQAMILAAGLGTRMGDLSQIIPKPMIALKGQPLISHLLQALKANGVNKAVINLFHLKNQIKDFLQDGSSYGIELTYSEEPELLGTGGGIVNALPLLDDAPFIVASADVYSSYQFSLLPKALTSMAHLVLVDNPSFKVKGDFALDGSQVKLTGNNMLTYANVGVYKKEFFRDPPGTIFPLSCLLQRAINNKLVTGEYFNGIWYNIGTLELLTEAERS